MAVTEGHYFFFPLLGEDEDKLDQRWWKQLPLVMVRQALPRGGPANRAALAPLAEGSPWGGPPAPPRIALK